MGFLASWQVKQGDKQVNLPARVLEYERNAYDKLDYVEIGFQCPFNLPGLAKKASHSLVLSPLSGTKGEIQTIALTTDFIQRAKANYQSVRQEFTQTREATELLDLSLPQHFKGNPTAIANHLWAYSAEFAQRFSMPKEHINPKLKGAEAVAYRYHRYNYKKCGYGAVKTACAYDSQDFFDFYLNSSAPLPWIGTRSAEVNNLSPNKSFQLLGLDQAIRDRERRGSKELRSIYISTISKSWPWSKPSIGYVGGGARQLERSFYQALDAVTVGLIGLNGNENYHYKNAQVRFVNKNAPLGAGMYVDGRYTKYAIMLPPEFLRRAYRYTQQEEEKGSIIKTVDNLLKGKYQ